jgi:hypothetical protein
MIAGTVMVWMEVLTSGYAWDELRDVPRFRKAFVRFAGSQRATWPQPADIIALLPAPEEHKLLSGTPSDPERIQAHIDDLATFLGVGRAH